MAGHFTSLRTKGLDKQWWMEVWIWDKWTVREYFHKEIFPCQVSRSQNVPLFSLECRLLSKRVDCLEEILTPLCRHSEIFIDEWQVYILLVFPSQTLIKTFKHELKYTGEKKKSFYFGFGNSFFESWKIRILLSLWKIKFHQMGKKSAFLP